MYIMYIFNVFLIFRIIYVLCIVGEHVGKSFKRKNFFPRHFNIDFKYIIAMRKPGCILIT